MQQPAGESQDKVQSSAMQLRLLLFVAAAAAAEDNNERLDEVMQSRGWGPCLNTQQRPAYFIYMKWYIGIFSTLL